MIFKNKNEFSLYIETLAVNSNLPVYETIVDYCEEHLLDVTDVVPMLNQSIISKLESEYTAKGLLPKQTTLDYD